MMVEQINICGNADALKYNFLSHRLGLQQNNFETALNLKDMCRKF
jgi:hypothetical protein